MSDQSLFQSGAYQFLELAFDPVEFIALNGNWLGSSMVATSMVKLKTYSFKDGPFPQASCRLPCHYVENFQFKEATSSKVILAQHVLAIDSHVARLLPGQFDDLDTTLDVLWFLLLRALRLYAQSTTCLLEAELIGWDELGYVLDISGNSQDQIVEGIDEYILASGTDEVFELDAQLVARVALALVQRLPKSLSLAEKQSQILKILLCKKETFVEEELWWSLMPDGPIV